MSKEKECKHGAMKCLGLGIKDMSGLICECECLDCTLQGNHLNEIIEQEKELAKKEERERMVEKINELTWYKNDSGVKEIEENTEYIKVDDIINSIKK